jgi:cobalt-zinc-cadmium efflux system outer membrane protein
MVHEARGPSRSWLSGRIVVCVVLAGLPAAGCARYVPAPIEPAQSLEDFEARSLDAPELWRYLEGIGVDSSAAAVRDGWDLRTLTLVAFFFSPAMDIARAEWGVAEGGVITAGGRVNPTFAGGVGYNSTTPTAAITPWIVDAVLDIPIDIAGKRGIRVAQARQLSESARLNVLTAAWQVRSRVRLAFLDLYVARQADSLLTAQQQNRAEIVQILERQLAVGEVSPYEVSQARIALAGGRVAALEGQRRRARAESELADAIGVPPAALDTVTLSLEGIGRVMPEPPEREIRLRALVNRSDILGALADYEASQEALRLEVRKQYPDFSFGPAYQLDQTDSKWTLGVGFSLPLLNRNQGPIAEAEARREAMAARFLALQSRTLGELDAAIVGSRSAAEQFRAADQLLESLTQQERTAAAAYRIGEISKLQLLTLRDEIVAAALSRLDALAGAQAAVGALEDAMQSPLDVGEWVLERPSRGSGKEGSNDD